MESRTNIKELTAFIKSAYTYKKNVQVFKNIHGLPRAAAWVITQLIGVYQRLQTN